MLTEFLDQSLVASIITAAEWSQETEKTTALQQHASLTHHTLFRYVTWAHNRYSRLLMKIFYGTSVACNLSSSSSLTAITHLSTSFTWYRKHPNSTNHLHGRPYHSHTNNIYLRHGGYVPAGVCLSVRNFTWKLLIGASWKFYQRCISG